MDLVESEAVTSDTALVAASNPAEFVRKLRTLRRPRTASKKKPKASGGKR